MVEDSIQQRYKPEKQIVMRDLLFTQFLNNIGSINSLQYGKLKYQINKLNSDKFVNHILETDVDNFKCPHCGNSKIHKWSIRSGLQRYRCVKCRKTFNSLTGTPLARLRKKEKWLTYSKCLIDGVSVRKAALVCGVHFNTCFRWRHRFLKNTTEIKAELLTGIVEADETYFLKSNKGERNLSRKARKRGNKEKPSVTDNKYVCVFISRDRKAYIYDKIFKNFNSSELSNVYAERILKDSLFCSDNKSVYKKFTKENNITHGCLDVTKGVVIKRRMIHIHNINLYHINLKKWMCRFNGVATKYLENYISWYRFLDEFKHNIKPFFVLSRSKSGGVYKIQPLTGI